MTDLTALFSTLLTTHSAPPIIPRRPPPRDQFLLEAYRITTHLRTLHQQLSRTRVPYLSTVRPTPSNPILTDSQRDELDASLKSSIRTILTLITRLESAEQIRAATAKSVLEKKYASFRAIFGDDVERRTEEARLGVENAHREAVIWGLKNALEIVSEEQRRRQEIRLQREVEKSGSLLHRIQGMRSTAPVVLAEEQGAAGVEELTQEQIQMFELENQGMVKHYEDTLQQVKYVMNLDLWAWLPSSIRDREMVHHLPSLLTDNRSAESSLIEISELQTQLATNLAHQNVHIDNLMQDSMTTEDNLARGNKQLKDAAAKSSIARSAFMATVMFSSVVFVWDWFI